ncbi:MAG: Gfo/Idh/MocA family protein [Phycisphaeraceae bacterium JB051]
MITNPNPLKVVLLGAGMAGENLAKEIRQLPNVQLVGVYDPNLKAASHLADIHNAMFHESFDTLVKETKPNIAAITSSNDAHPVNVRQSIEAGIRNVFCEKPLALALEDAQQMIDLAEQHQVRTSMGFAGIHVGYAKVIDLIQSGDLGRVLNLYVHTYRGYGFWEQERINARGMISRHTAVKFPAQSGGWTIHHACHLVYVMMLMAGDIQSVLGHLGTSHPNCPSEEVVHATLNFANGAVGTMTDSIGSFRGIRCGVIGTRGTLLMSDDYTKHDDDRIELRVRYEGESIDQVKQLSYDKQAISRFSEFVQAIVHHAPSPITFRQGMENLRICHAIQQSGQRNELIHLNPATAKMANA